MGRRLGKHYSGGIVFEREITRIEILPGWPICASGLAGRRILADPSRHTSVIAEVTCKACRRQLEQAGRIPVGSVDPPGIPAMRQNRSDATLSQRVDTFAEKPDCGPNGEPNG